MLGDRSDKNKKKMLHENKTNKSRESSHTPGVHTARTPIYVSYN